MELDADCLYEARPENVERLARSLGVRLPPHRGRDMTYNRKLVRLVLKHLELDALRARDAHRHKMARS
jgi:hypothetical protein